MKDPAIEKALAGFSNACDSDVALASYPGSGNVWLANILLELGLCFFDPYTETVPPSSSTHNVILDRSYRARIRAYYRIDTGLLKRRRSPRILKTHLFPGTLSSRVAGLGGAILLTRHPCLSILSYFYWRCAFSEQGEGGSLQEFLGRPGVNRLRPGDDWGETNRSWLSAKPMPKGVLHIRFEDVRNDPEQSMGEILDWLGNEVDEDEVVGAVEESTFKRMREHEDKMFPADPRRIMRSGHSSCASTDAANLALVRQSLPARTLEIARILGYDL